VQEFRKFWGEDIVQTRRFATGEITLAVVWDKNQLTNEIYGSTTTVVERIVKHLVMRHVNSEAMPATISFPGSMCLER